jgi:ubiquinone biosynthesis protein
MFGRRATSWLRRGFQVAGILWRHGLGPHLRTIGLARFLPSTPDRELDPETAGLEMPVRVRMACEEIGPVTIKLAQALASRPDLVPLEYAREFRRLQDNVQPFDPAVARQLVESELSGTIEELFADFGDVPAASASIGQVHFATLHDGHRVAVKVERPQVEAIVETDLQILSFAANRAEASIRVFRDYRVSEWVGEFARSLRAELDLTIEGHNTDRLRESLADDPNVGVPRVHWPMTTHHVLTLDRVDGARIDDLEGLRALGVSPASVAMHLAQSILRQLFVNGFFHADPHAGNLLVQRGGRVVFLDCGNAVSIGRDMREAMVRLVLAALDDDAVEVCDQIIDMGIASEDTDLQKLRVDIARVMGRYAAVSTAEFAIGELLEEVMGVIFRHRMRMPTVFASVLRALILAEGNCRQLDKGFDFRVPAREVGNEVLREWVRPSNILRELWRAARDLQRYSVLIPRQVHELLAKTQSGGLRVRFEMERFDESLHRLDTMFNRLAFALVVAAIIVGSSVILASERAVSLLSTPGAIAYVLIGALMGLYLLYSILTSGRL